MHTLRSAPYGLWLALALGALTNCPLSAQAATATKEPKWAAAVTAAIEAQQQRDRIPGLTCAIGVGREIPYVRGFGLADVENDLPATAQTVYRLASISKPVTAVLALQLAEQGKLDLDRDVADLLPEWPRKPWPVTVRQLLGHLGGVRHYRPGEVESTQPFRSQRESLARFAGDPLVHEPGTAYLYSTYGYNLVAAVVEQVLGQDFATAVRERVAKPCAAPTLQDDSVRRLIRGRAQGYVLVRGELQNSQLLDASYKLGGGGLCATAPDLVRFGQALQSGRLLEAATLQAMCTPQRLADGKATGYGLGLSVGQKGERRTISHSGAQARVSTMMYCLPGDGLPEDGVVVVLLCNLERLKLGGLAQQIAGLVLGD